MKVAQNKGLSGIIEDLSRIDRSIDKGNSKLANSLEMEKKLLNDALSSLYKEKNDLLMQKDKLKEIYPELNLSFLSNHNIIGW